MSVGFNFFRLVSVSKLFLRFFLFSNVFLVFYSQKNRFTINAVLSLPVIKNFYAVTLFLVTRYALRCYAVYCEHEQVFQISVFVNVLVDLTVNKSLELATH